MPRTTSIVTVCRNRREHLLTTAPRVSAWPHHGEHLIVDWSSDEPLRREELPGDPRIRLLRVEGERRWNLCRAYNFGLRQASGDCLFKLDADAWPERLDHPDALAAGAGLCRFGSGPDGRLGQFLIDRPLLEAVGGFNEMLWGYGFDDKDLKARLRAQGTEPQELPEAALGVIVHATDLRVGATAGRSSALERRRGQALKAATSLANRVASAHCPWHARAAASRYIQTGPQTWRADPAALPQPPEPVRRELDRLRRVVFWSRFLAIPELYVEWLPEKLLPGDADAAFPLAPWHRLYFHTIRRLTDLPVLLLAAFKGSLAGARGRR